MFTQEINEKEIANAEGLYLEGAKGHKFQKEKHWKDQKSEQNFSMDFEKMLLFCDESQSLYELKRRPIFRPFCDLE